MLWEVLHRISSGNRVLHRISSGNQFLDMTKKIDQKTRNGISSENQVLHRISSGNRVLHRISSGNQFLDYIARADFYLFVRQCDIHSCRSISVLSKKCDSKQKTLGRTPFQKAITLQKVRQYTKNQFFLGPFAKKR